MTKYRSVNDALPALAHMLLTEGADVPSRVGRTKELAFQHFTILDPLQREIVVHNRKANIAAQIAETMWVLGGRNDVEWLSAYLPRAADFSDDGTTWRAGYGPRLRAWIGEDDRRSVDQMESVIALLREDPSTRRAVMSIFDPAVDYQPSKDIPCNNWLHFLARDGVLHLHVATRSNDVVWGWSGINQFEWSVLLEVVAHYSGLKVGSIHYAVSSLHMYDRHWGKAQGWKVRTVHTQRDRRFDAHGLEWDLLVARWFELEKRIRGVADNRPACTGTGCQGCLLAKDISAFPDPMLRAWLWVLGWWWTGEEGWLASVQDTRLWHAAQVGTGPRKVPAATHSDAQSPVAVVDGVRVYPGQVVLTRQDLGVPANESDEAARAVEMQPTRPRAQVQRAHPANVGRFVRELTTLHTEKDAAYGTSWKKRGELFSILPNIARKADRLGAGDTTDENQTDTACDLLVYLAKYRSFLYDTTCCGTDHGTSDTVHKANDLIRMAAETASMLEQPWTTVELEEELRAGVDEMMAAAEAKDPDRFSIVDHLLLRAAVLAMRRWRETPALFAPLLGADEYRGADRD